MIRLCAIEIDETGDYDRDWLEGCRPWEPKIWSVYLVRPNQPSYVASLIPSTFAMHAYSYGEPQPGTPPEIREKMASDLRSIDLSDCFLDFKMVQEIVRDGRHALDLGLFKTTDESLADCRDAWEDARDSIRSSRPL